MRQDWVVVGEETPSLATALADLLQVDGIRVLLVPAVAPPHILEAGDLPARPRVLVSTSARHGHATVRLWRDGPWNDSNLVLVGCRDGGLRSEGRLHIVSLPMVAEEFLGLIRKLLALQGASGELRSSKASAPEPRQTVRRSRTSDPARPMGQSSRPFGRG